MKFKVLDGLKFMKLVECSTEEFNRLKSNLTKDKSINNYNRRLGNFWVKTDTECFIDSQGIVKIGLWKDILNFCKAFNYSLKIEGIEKVFNGNFDEEHFRIWIDKKFKTELECTEEEILNNLYLYPAPHQIEASIKILKNNIGLLQLATAAGKSLIIYIVFSYLLEKDSNHKFLMIVPKLGLIEQGLKDFEDYNIKVKIKTLFRGQGLTGSEVLKPYSNVVVGNYQTLTKKDVKFFSKFTIINCDECHSAKSTSIKKIMSKSNALIRFGTSGTIPDDLSYDYFSIAQNFGPILIKVTASELMESNWISQLKITVLLLKYYSEEQLSTHFENRESLEGRELLDIERNLLINSEKRLEFITDLIGKSDKNVLVLFHHVSYGEKLFQSLQNVEGKETFYISGKTKKDERESIRCLMEEGSNKILVASYGTFSTGLNVKNLHYVYFTESFKSPIIILQSIGRGLRKHKDKDYLKVIDISDDFRFSDYSSKLYLQSIARKKLYKKEKFSYSTITKNIDN